MTDTFSYSAAQELWLYYETIPTTVRNCLFRWAHRCIQYDENGGVYNSPALQSSVFQDSQTGVYANLASDTLYLSSDTYCNVGTPMQRTSGSVSGSMIYDCGVVSVAMVNDPNRDSSGLDTNKNSQTECSFAVFNNTNVVAAFMNTHLSEYTLGGPVAPFPGIPSPRMASWAVSTDGGAHFTDKGPVPPISTITNGSTIITNGASNALYGDAGDTTVGYDPQKGVVYLLANPSRENTNFYGFRLWASRDNGQTFGPVNMDVPGRDINGSHFISVADKPALRLSGTNIYVAGSESGPRVWAAHSSNAGTNWDAPHILDTASNGDVRGVDILIVPDGTVYYFWLSSSGTANQLRYTYLATNGAWATTANIGSILNSTNTVNGSGNLLRYNGANSNDYFIDNCFPKACYANGNIYIVYADTPTSTPTTDRGDIFMLEASVNWSTHALAVSTGPKKVNNDRTQTDQWDPSIAANPPGTEVFVGYYSRQNDPVTNSWIMAYGAKAYMTNGLANATFECFPVSPTSFQPVFAGTSATPSNPLTYDPVWPPPGICLDGNAVFNGLHTPGIFCPPGVDGPEPDGTIGEYMNFCADDYTCSAADAAYFYLAWCDRTRVYQMTRPDADIKFARVRQ